jgi:methylenetetrahydrofolate reductase (NADPH)
MTFSAAAIARPDSQSEPFRHIAEFMSRASFETTRLSAADLGALAQASCAGSRVYVSAVPSRPPSEQLDIATRLKAHGYEPIPHIAARSFASGQALDQTLARLVGEAGVRRALVIAGDRPEPAGPFHSALELIDSGLLQGRGIEEIGIAGYPEGHPRIASLELDRALVAKMEAAEQTGLSVHIVTQFAFSPAPILAWLTRLRDLGIDQPVRVGFAGPTTLANLMRYARVCGVKASAQGLARHSGLVKNLFGLSTPDALVRPLAQAIADGGLGEVTPHIYSFGGLAVAMRWADAVAAGHFHLDGATGFSVELQ